MADIDLKADAQWGQPCLGYSVQATFDAGSIEKLLRLQSAVASKLSAEAFWTPPDALHVSIFNLIHVRSIDDGKAEAWAAIRESAIAELERAEPWTDIAIGLSEISVTETAIILWTPDQPEPILRSRSAFGKIASDFGLPRQTHDRTHVTLGRPAVDARLNAPAVDQVEKTQAAITLGLAQIRLVRETRYPSLNVDVIAYRSDRISRRS